MLLSSVWIYQLPSWFQIKKVSIAFFNGLSYFLQYSKLGGSKALVPARPGEVFVQ
jgi:hypothetical protein